MSPVEACQMINEVKCNGDEAKCFATFDTVKGFHQIPLKEES